MKKLFTFISLIALSYFAQARILTVSNVAGQAAMFTVVQTAVDSAQVGDTVFVHASSLYTPYGAVSIKKRIVLLGEGGMPDWNVAKPSRFVSQLGAITIDSISGIQVSGTQVNGVRVSSITVINSNLKSIIVKNCNIADYGANLRGIGHIIYNNIFQTAITIDKNCIFSNNYVHGYITSGTGCTVANNVINGTITNFTSSTIVNNIFIATNAISDGVSNSYSKNLQVGTDLPAGNYTNEPLATTFKEAGIISSMDYNTYFTATFELKVGCPGIAGGTDGKDVGVHGGQYPWPANKFLNGDPGLPKVQSVEVQNAVLAPGATLKVNLKAKSASTKQ